MSAETKTEYDRIVDRMDRVQKKKCKNATKPLAVSISVLALEIAELIVLVRDMKNKANPGSKTIFRRHLTNL